jgi:NitT/TauT family transport system ATP-binding protein
MTNRTQPVLKVKNVSLHYAGADTGLLTDFHLELAAGEIVTVLGPSGVGKSSLLRVLAGLQAPDTGSIFVTGTRISSVHPRVQITFQNPGLLPWLDVERNVAFGLDFKRQPKLRPEERRKRIDTAIDEVGIGHARHLRPAELSGGMAQRTALARCLARQPKILLLDEPFGALDEVTRSEMQTLLLRAIADFRTAAVLVTHDIDEALLVSDRMLLLGGAPATTIGEWTIALPKPRGEFVSELGALRVDILTTLRNVIHGTDQRIEPC